MMNIIAIDPSTTCVGVCINTQHGKAETRAYRYRRSKSVPRFEQLSQLWHDFVKLLNESSEFDLAVIEQYSMNSFGNSATKLAEVGGVLRLLLTLKKIPILEIAPATWKSIACLKYDIPKGDIAERAEHLYGVRFGTQDECDAFLMERSVEIVLQQDSRHLTSTEKKLRDTLNELLK